MKRFLLAALFMLACAAAQAKGWNVDMANSKLTFAGDQNGEIFQGGFKKFAAQVSFDAAHPETSKIAVTVDLASAYAGSADRDSMLPQKDWFDIARSPQAQWVSTSVRQTGPNSFVADGTLTLKGVTHALALPFSLEPEGDHWRVKGGTHLLRSDFNIGQGMFANENYVKYDVTIGFDLSARPRD